MQGDGLQGHRGKNRKKPNNRITESEGASTNPHEFFCADRYALPSAIKGTLCVQLHKRKEAQKLQSFDQQGIKKDRNREPQSFPFRSFV